MKKRLVILLCAWGCVYTNAYALPEVIDNSAYPPSARPANNTIAATPSTNTLIEITGRLDQLQTEVQQLTGKVEEQANTIAELKKQQKTMYADIDDRLQTIENKASDTTQPADPASVETPPESESQAPAEPAAATPSTETAAEPAAETAAPENKPQASAVQVPDAEKQEYQAAYDTLRRGHTDQSIAEFNAYLEKYPTGGLANNAQYWLGEAYRVKQDDNAARAAFNKVVDNYPGSAKVPDALLMLGKIELEQSNPDKAREYFTQVTTNYPTSPAARLAAKKLLQLNISN
ncbi:MAG: tol-pal system protein YbgF [Methylovulum sp.]|nr:tol-pal system protein YbgF [Methylovulum sp.]